MDTSSGFKHFSHAHNLVIHHTDEAAKMISDGCNSSVIGTTYICWQCDYALHEQCFRATRSLKHPSHPSDPLTLLPYSTYTSNSFGGNICELSGSGLSYSCSDCEFDIHVHCAYNSISDVYPPSVVQNSNNNVQYSSVAPNTPVEIPASERERLNRDEQRLKIAREEYRIAALGRQYALDLI